MTRTIYLIGIFLILSACVHNEKNVEIKLPKASQSGFAEVNGIRMYYEVHGEGPPLVLIHGGGSTIESNFFRVLPLFSKTHRVIAMEEQGHGHTPVIDRPFTFENSADDIAALLDFLKVDKADIFGFSNGGNIAMQIAIRHPKKVNKLIVASAMIRRSGLPKSFWKSMQSATLAQMPQYLKDADRKINPDPRHLVQLFQQDSYRMKNFKDLPIKDVKSIKAKTLIMIGDQDIILPEHAINMSRLIPKARLAILPANHGNYLEGAGVNDTMSVSPELAVALINEFLTSNK
jgi:pimeloyl-ACP methyl ester carboxylesterase